jgi:hypothetical protein
MTTDDIGDTNNRQEAKHPNGNRTASGEQTLGKLSLAAAFL